MAASIPTKLFVLCGLLSGLPGPVDASPFKFLDKASTAGAVNPKIRGALLSEIEDAFGELHRRTTESRLVQLEEMLHHTFDALPKNEYGNLGHASTRYLLHRLFVEKHGWSVRGLEPNGEAWNTSSAMQMFEGRVPELVLTVFEERLAGHGVSLHEAAVLAATLENLVHTEAIERLSAAFNAQQLPVESELSREQLEEVVDTYMMTYVLGVGTSDITPEYVKVVRTLANEVYPTWNETQAFARDVQREVVPGDGRPVVYADAMRAVEEIGERYGHWQDTECRALKQELMSLEDNECSGRVPLNRFYSGNLHGGKWQFSESVDYLRQMGALDESDPKHVSVILANYIGGPSNCIASSTFYSVCCLDECEGLMDHIEREVMAPDASPEQLAHIVESLPSATVSGNRTLSPALLGRLHEIAAHHGGRVPLHSRLFAQWMHHNYPDECQYPHITGTTKPQQAEVYEATGVLSSASTEEMQQHIDQAPKSRRASSPEDEDEATKCLPWSDVEELLAARPATELAPTVGGSIVVVRVVVLLAAVAAFGSVLWGLACYLKRSAANPTDSEPAKILI